MPNVKRITASKVRPCTGPTRAGTLCALPVYKRMEARSLNPDGTPHECDSFANGSPKVKKVAV
jgi:hypothetical protein